MAGFTFNIAKGRVGEFFFRVKNNDPSASALLVVVLAESGLESDATLIDKDTLSDVLSGTTNEVTNTNYARKTLTDADLGTFTPDDANDRFDYDMPDPVWSPGPSAGDNWRKMVVAYDGDTGAGTDADVVPLFAQDILVNPDGNIIQLQIASSGAWRAQ